MVVQVLAIACLTSVVWLLVGYSLAFAPGNALIGGFDRVGLAGLTVTGLTGAIPESVFMLFQMTFAIITPALIAGAFADRMTFGAMLAFTGGWSILVYAPVAHWVWGGGFLFQDAVLDYAGGTVVHINAGVAGLVAALVLGRRRGWTGPHLLPHNLVMTATGAALLWVGWFGFNAGSALAADGRAGMAMAVTQIAAAGAALAWLAVEWLGRGRPSLLGLASGAIAGLVAITPASGFVGPLAALAIGLIAGPACYAAVAVLKPRLGYDDALDCFGVHGVGGIVGALLTGVFAEAAIGGVPGLIEGNAEQVFIQFKGVLATIGWSSLVSFVLLKLIAAVMPLRVAPQEERDGLDLALHGEALHT
jgi:Amt family ammonium transporter